MCNDNLIDTLLPLLSSVPTVDWKAAERALVAYVEEYVMEGDDGFYTPTESDKCMLIDCINGLLVDEDFCKALAIPVTAQQKCDWVQDSDGTWHSGCGTSFEFNDGKPSENGAKFCHSCGKPLVEIPYTEESENEDPS